MSPWRGSKLTFCRAKLMKKEPPRDYWAEARPKIKSRPGANFVLYEKESTSAGVEFALNAACFSFSSDAVSTTAPLSCWLNDIRAPLAWATHAFLCADFDNWHTRSDQRAKYYAKLARLSQFKLIFSESANSLKTKSKVSWYTKFFALLKNSTRIQRRVMQISAEGNNITMPLFLVLE